MEGTNLKIIIIINKEGKEKSGTDLSNHYDDFFKGTNIYLIIWLIKIDLSTSIIPHLNIYCLLVK